MRFLYWFAPGLYIKRWLVLFGIGILAVSIGINLILEGTILGFLAGEAKKIFQAVLGNTGGVVGGGVLAVAGGVLILLSIREMGKAFIRLDFPGCLHNRVKSVYQRQYLRRGPRIVVIGGGTGLSVLLRGLKEYTSNLTAIVSVTDDGGSSGRLRGQFGILPPGDLRNCLLALADTEPAMENLFNYRFEKGKELAGHSLGNLLIAAMAELTGSFETAIREVSKVLAIRGRVLPSTLDNIVLAAELQDGSMIMGESNISGNTKPIKKVFTIPGCCKPFQEALEAILEADAVILGPGSLYTSVMPNLLVPGIVDALRKNRGIKIYVCNIMTQPGETIGYSASDHLRAIYHHAGPGLVEYVIVNNKEIPAYYKEKYAREGAGVVRVDLEKLGKLNVKVIASPLIQEEEHIRHNSRALAEIILKLVMKRKGYATRGAANCLFLL